MNNQKKDQKIKTKCNKTSSVLRVDFTVADIITNELDQLKRKKKGSGKINASAILSKVLPKLTDSDRNEILAQSVTGEDRQKVAFGNYIKKHKKTSKSQFLDLVLYGEININEYLPEEMRRQR